MPGSFPIVVSALSLFLGVFLGGCAGGVPVKQSVAPAAYDEGHVDVWTTTSDQRLALAPSTLRFGTEGGSADIKVEAATRYQQMVGFGDQCKIFYRSIFAQDLQHLEQQEKSMYQTCSDSQHYAIALGTRQESIADALA